MKKNYLHYYLPFTLILLLVSSGCRKADTTIDNISKIDNSIAKSAIQFLLSQKNNSNYTEQQSVDTLLIKFNWGNGTMYNINTEKALLYFPSSINENISLVFAYDKLSNKIDSGNLILLNKSITESKASSQIIFSFLRNIMSNYSGSISTYTLNNKFKQEDGFKNGKKIYQKKLVSLKINATQAKIKTNGVVKTNGDDDCIAWFWVMANEDGSQTWSYLYTQCGLCEPNFFIDLNTTKQQIKVNCGNAGGSGPLVPNIAFSISNLCIRQTLNTLMMSFNPIMNKVKTDFSLVSSYSIHYSDVTNLNNNQNAETNFPDPSYDGSRIDISLNQNILASASVEFTAKVILHESMHALILANGVTETELMHHNTMASVYVNDIIIGLQSIFPSLSDEDAAALAWAGLETSTAYQALPPATQSLYSTISLSYRSGSRGSSCN
ncbi:MAG: hypothetical protein V4450_06865 [Bacteroidota bacterium]